MDNLDTLLWAILWPLAYELGCLIRAYTRALNWEPPATTQEKKEGGKVAFLIWVAGIVLI